MNNEILEPVISMTILTFGMMIWMYATRIPASKYIEKKGIDLQDLSHPSNLGGVFPSKVERVADNYNHLFVQVRGRGDAYYQSNLVPRSHLLKNSNFDPLG